MRYVAAAINQLYKNREAITGLNRVYATKLLSHFTARFEPIGASTAAQFTSGAVTAAVNGASAAADAVASGVTAAADKITRGLQKVGLGGVAGAPAGDAEESPGQSDVAAGGVRDSFAQEAQQPLTQQQAW
jgi:hypothetical protein